MTRMPGTLPTSWTSPWWTFQLEGAGLESYLYCGFNLAEGASWIVFAIIVWRRFLKHRNSRWEIIYAAAFLVFAATDFAEAMAISLPLLIFKAVILAALLSLRKHVQKSYYPCAWF